MWSHNNSSAYYGHISHTSTMPCLCAGCHANVYDYNPMNQYLYNNVNVLPNDQQAPQDQDQDPFSHLNNPPLSPFSFHDHDHDQEAMATNETDSWLLLNGQDHNPWSTGNNQYQGQFNHLQTDQGNDHHGNYGMLPAVQYSREGLVEQQQDQQIYDFSRDASFLNATLQPTGTAIVLEATSVNLPRELARNLRDETVGSHSNSTASLSSEDASKKPLKFPPSMSRQERVLRYFEKKKSRKYEKKIQYSSRKIYAQTRPRVRGRFARKSQVDDDQH